MSKSINRRTLLGILTVSATVTRAPRSAAAGRRIVVIGAGIAGLAAARRLRQAGADVVVMEARDRVGGRLWTSRAWPDLPVDLGASWIHGTTGNPITALAREAGLRLVSTSYDASLSLNADGVETDIDAAARVAREVIKAARAAADRLDRDLSLSEALARHPRFKTLDSSTRRLFDHVANAEIEQEYGGGLSESSAWHFDSTKVFGGGDVLMPDGYDAIPLGLARDLDVRLAQPVRSIARTTAGVTIETLSGGALSADAAVVAVPLGALRAGTPRFGAPLAASRARAIETLRMGLLNKCWLRFDRVAWPDNVDWIEWIGPRNGRFAQWVSLARAARLPVLLAFHAADEARAMEKLDDRATVEAAHAALKAMFGAAFPKPIAAQVTRWSQDPFALGAYSFNAVGASPETRKALAGLDWDGRLAFAGEATSADYFGTVHGAYLSGLAAADALIAG